MVNDLNNVIRSLQSLEITSTYQNMSVLMACIQKLMDIRDEVESKEKGGEADGMDG